MQGKNDRAGPDSLKTSEYLKNGEDFEGSLDQFRQSLAHIEEKLSSNEDLYRSRLSSKHNVSMFRRDSLDSKHGLRNFKKSIDFETRKATIQAESIELSDNQLKKNFRNSLEARNKSSEYPRKSNFYPPDRKNTQRGEHQLGSNEAQINVKNYALSRDTSPYFRKTISNNQNES